MQSNEAILDEYIVWSGTMLKIILKSYLPACNERSSSFVNESEKASF